MSDEPRRLYRNNKLTTKLSHRTTTVHPNPFYQESDQISTATIKLDVCDHPIPSTREPSMKSFAIMFHGIIPPQPLFDILEQVCEKRDEYWIFNQLAFRSLQYRDLYPGFVAQIAPYYKSRFNHFVMKPLTYSSFVTILRHICKMNHIQFDRHDNYRSSYNIDYYIYHNNKK